MPETVAEVGDIPVVETTKFAALIERSSRAAIWGTLASVGAFLAAPIIAVSSSLMVLGGIGAVVGGIGTVVAGSLILRKSNARLQWRAAGLLGLPFGTSLVVYGMSQIFWYPLSAAAAFGPPLVIRLALFGLIFLGPVLAVLVGMDVVRFLLRGGMNWRVQDPAEGDVS